MGQDSFIHNTLPAKINLPQGQNLTVFRKSSIARNPADPTAPFHVVHPDGYIEPISSAALGVGVMSVTGYNVDNTDPANPVILSTQVDGITITGSGTIGDPFVASAPVVNAWMIDGNTLGAKRTLGSLDNFDVGFITNNTERFTIENTGEVVVIQNAGIGAIPASSVRLYVKGFGSTSATTALLVQNSASGESFYVGDDKRVGVNSIAPNGLLMVQGDGINNIFSAVIGAYDNKFIVQPDGKSVFGGSSNSGFLVTIDAVDLADDGLSVSTPGGLSRATLTYHATSKGTLRLYDDLGTINVRFTGSAQPSFINNGQNFGIGTVSPDSGMLVDLVSTTQAFGVMTMTTAERDIIIPVNRMIIYNNSLDKFQGYAGGAWVDFH